MTSQSLSRRQFGRLTLGVVSMAALGGVGRLAAATEAPSASDFNVRIEASFVATELQISVYLTNRTEARNLVSGSTLAGVLTHADGTETAFAAYRHTDELHIGARVTPLELIALPSGVETFCGVWSTGVTGLPGARVTATFGAYFEGAINLPAVQLQAAPVDIA